MKCFITSVCVRVCVRVCAQEEPDDLSDSSHPAIVPLKDAPPITEVESHSPTPNYITVHYSKLSRFTTSILPLCHCSVISKLHSSVWFTLHCSPSATFTTFSVPHLFRTICLQQSRWLKCYISVHHRIYFTDDLALLRPSLSFCQHIVCTLLSLPSLLFCSNTFCLCEGSKFIIPALVVWKKSTLLEHKMMCVQTNSYGFCLLWCSFSPEQVQVHNLPLGGNKKPKDSSKVVYTLLHPPHYWPGEKTTFGMKITYMFYLKTLKMFNSLFCIVWIRISD